MGFPASFNLAELNGRNGFVINGIDVGYISGGSVSSAGDFNGDGFDDILIGGAGGDVNDNLFNVESYVVFGSSQDFSSSVNLSQLNGNNGVTLRKTFDETEILGLLGYATSSAGDFNGDGLSDILIGSEIRFPGSSAPSGEVYVIFGNTQGFDSSLDLSSLSNETGFTINVPEVLYASFGNSLSFPISTAGDVNNDGFDDFLIGTPQSRFIAFDINQNVVGQEDGNAHIIFGSEQIFSTDINLSTLDSDKVDNLDIPDRSSKVVSSAGDFNGDGFDDFLISARGADLASLIHHQTDEIYLIFGNNKDSILGVDLANLNGNNGFLFRGLGIIEPNSSNVVSGAGDINGDGFEDILIGQSWADVNENSNAGKTYVVFGSNQGFAPSFNLDSLNGSNGFVLNGINSEDRSGHSVSSAGDFNGDGFDDILISARGADPNGNRGAGETYLIFGSDQGFNPSIDLASLDGSDGFVINGVNANDISGWSVSNAGDINNDGFDDILIGAIGAAPNEKPLAGATYAVFGRASHTAIEWDTETGIVSSFGISLSAGKASTTPIGRTIQDKNWELQTTGDLNGDGQADVILRHALAGQLLAWTMAPGGQSIQSEAIIGRELTDTNWSIDGSGDLNGDGNVDLILRNQAADQIIAWYMDGKGDIQSEELIGRGFGDNNWNVEVMADFNDDGKADMVLRNRLSGQHLLWEMDGGTILAETLIGRDIPDQNWYIEGARDFDNNGTVDLFLRHRGIGQGLLWSMKDKAAIASEQLITNVPTGTSQLVF